MADSPWEDHLLERKVESDLKDLPKTLVAFANSVRPGHTAVILIGERNDGSPQGVTNPDNIQKRVREDCNEIYPPIVWRARVYDNDGKQCVRVEIEYDGETPHFGGAAWVRRGSVTEKATDDAFQRLIDFRSSKVRELAQWVDKDITVNFEDPTHPHKRTGTQKATLRFVNGFWLTYELGRRQSKPLEKVSLSWDDENNRLELIFSA